MTAPFYVQIVHSGDGPHAYPHTSEKAARGFVQRSTSVMMRDGWRATFAGTDCVVLRRDLQSVVLLVTRTAPISEAAS